MKVLVLGAGVVGTCAAYWLARDGHEVTVIERHDGPAQGTSRSNAGLISPGDATAWASPAALKTFLRSLYTPDLGIRVKIRFDPYFYRWSLRFFGECTTARMRANTLVKLRLALFSRDCMNEIAAETGIDYDQRSKGILYFFRTQRSFDAGVDAYRFLADNGLVIDVVDRSRLAEIEPALSGVRDRIAGGIHAPADQTGDSSIFVRRLADYASAQLGVEFRFGTTIEALNVEGGRVSSVRTSAGPISGDAVVIAMGPESGLFGRSHGIDLPVYPVKGYTVTAPLVDESKGPTMGGADEDRLIGYSRLGNRLRMSSTAEFTGFDRGHRQQDFATMLNVGKELFPGAFDGQKAEFWAGLRPMMPSSVPVLGQARYENLYLDTGHGHLGWTMAAGSGRFLADQIAGRMPGIDPQGLLYESGVG